MNNQYINAENTPIQIVIDTIRQIQDSWFKSNGASRLMYTISPNGTQLRAWFGAPGYSCPDHVDSGGKGLLWGTKGNPEIIEGIAAAIEDGEFGLCYMRATFPNQMQILVWDVQADQKKRADEMN